MACKHGNMACRLCAMEEARDEAKHLRKRVEKLERELQAARRQHGSAAQAVARIIGSDVVIGRERRSLEWLKDAKPFDHEPGTILYTAPPVADAVAVYQKGQITFNGIAWLDVSKDEYDRLGSSIKRITFTAPVADAEGVKGLYSTLQRLSSAALRFMNAEIGYEIIRTTKPDRIEAHKVELDESRLNLESAIDAAQEMVAALSRRPAAAAESLADRFDKFVAEPPVGAAEQPAAGQAKAAPETHAYVSKKLRQNAQDMVALFQSSTQAAQGEGLTEALERIAAYIERRKKSRGLDIEHVHGFDLGPNEGVELLLSDIETIAAHTTKERSERETRASDGKDAGRLDWMIHRGARISHSMDGEACNVWLPAERDGTEERPAEGYPQKRYNDGRDAIDAAMQQAASK